MTVSCAPPVSMVVMMRQTRVTGPTASRGTRTVILLQQDVHLSVGATARLEVSGLDPRELTGSLLDDVEAEPLALQLHHSAREIPTQPLYSGRPELHQCC